MSTKRFAVIAFLIFALILAFQSPSPARAQASKTTYPSVAPLDQYLMDRDAEIALARSAGPEAISRDAKVVVLGRHGYETAVEGRNGFVCVVERSWLGPFDASEFWNPKVRGPNCYNPPAVRSILPIVYLRTQMVLAGLSIPQMIERTKAAYAKKELPPPEPGAMCFMMAKQAYLTDGNLTQDGAHNMAHLMFYTPLMDGANWGADLPKSPIYLAPWFKGNPEPIDVFLVPTGTWSDGSAAPLK